MTWVLLGNPGRALTILMRTGGPVAEGPSGDPAVFWAHALTFYTRAVLLHPHTADILDNPVPHALEDAQQHL